MIRRICKTKPVVLFIDDVQWLDEASKTLLRHLLREFPLNGPAQVAIIVTRHERTVLRKLGFAKPTRLEVPFPAREERVQILTDGIGLNNAAAEQIVNRMGSTIAAQGGLVWLQQIVATPARADHLVATEDGFDLRDGQWPQRTGHGRVRCSYRRQTVVAQDPTLWRA